MIRAAAALAMLAAAALVPAAWADPAVPEPEGYHGEPYRSAVPDTLRGGTVLDAAGVAAAQAQGAVLIDVLPETRRPDGLPAGTVWRVPPHLTVPGAMWLPGTGYDRLSPQDEARFAAALDRISGGDRKAPLVFFCKADCWMSWNAAKRAISLGYGRVGWFPGGTDDWDAAGNPLVPATAD